MGNLFEVFKQQKMSSTANSAPVPVVQDGDTAVSSSDYVFWSVDPDTDTLSFSRKSIKRKNPDDSEEE